MRRVFTRVYPSSLLSTPLHRPLFTLHKPSTHLQLTLTHPRPSSSILRATMATSSPSSSPLPPVEGKITNKLKEGLKPIHLEVINESYKHKVPPGSESHFKVVIVSEVFNDKSLIDRHSIPTYQLCILLLMGAFCDYHCIGRGLLVCFCDRSLALVGGNASVGFDFHLLKKIHFDKLQE